MLLYLCGQGLLLWRPFRARAGTMSGGLGGAVTCPSQNEIDVCRRRGIHLHIDADTVGEFLTEALFLTEK